MTVGLILHDHGPGISWDIFNLKWVQSCTTGWISMHTGHVTCPCPVRVPRECDDGHTFPHNTASTISIKKSGCQFLGEMTDLSIQFWCPFYRWHHQNIFQARCLAISRTSSLSVNNYALKMLYCHYDSLSTTIMSCRIYITMFAMAMIQYFVLK